jgi:hypothetical protein
VTRDEIVGLLTELGRRLVARDTCGEMYVVGGAAIALAFDERRTTRDVDAVFEPKTVIYALARQLGEERHLEDGWLNDAVKGFLIGGDETASVVLDVPGLRVSTASPRVLLAMKVLAHRVGEDDGDLRLLADALGLRSPDGVLAVAQEVYGDRLDVAARFFVEEALAHG